MKWIEDWPRISNIFNDALELPEAKRKVFLDGACGDDEALRHRIERMIRDEEAADDILQRPLVSLGETTPDQDPELGRSMGPYRLVRRLARGGMGTVFLAHRTDGEVEQQVAIKLLRPGLVTDELIQRFRAERQALVRLRHPHVAQLLDVGTTDDGLPYMVMEYVEGRSIDEYCDEAKLTVPERIQLFRQLCEAVTFAHNNGIIHRDLKPANILVTGGGSKGPGQVKLLDFGVAKFVDPQSPLETLTDAEQLAPMTRLYASPEQQVLEGTVTTLSDVYSLGAVLYELLAGHRAHRVSTTDPVDAARSVHESLPTRPSLVVTRPADTAGAQGAHSPLEIARRRRTDPRRLRRTLMGDLDKIVLRALQKEAGRRFVSVAELSEDLRRYLAGLPILSRSDSLVYRGTKLVRRHPWGAATALAMLALIVGSTISIGIQNHRITQQNKLISQQRDLAEETLAVLIDILGASDPRRAQGEVPDLRDVLDRAVILGETKHREQPEVWAAVLDAVGVVYMSLDLHREARTPLERALALRRKHLEALSPDLADSLHHLAQLELREGHHRAAAEWMRQALDIQRKAYPDGHRDLATGLNNYASLLRKRGRLEAAEEYVREALAMKRRVLGQDDVDVATSLNLLGHLLKEQGRLAEAEDLYRQAIDIRRRAGDHGHPSLAVYLNSLATLYLEHLDRAAEAIPLHREALRIRRTVYGDADHNRLLNSLNNTAVALTLEGQYVEAGELFAEAQDMAERLDRALFVNKNEAMRLAAVGDFVGCESLTAKVLAEEQNDIRIAEAQSIHGYCLVGLGRTVDGHQLMSEGHRALVDALGHETRRTRQALERLAASASGSEHSPQVVER